MMLTTEKRPLVRRRTTRRPPMPPTKRIVEQYINGVLDGTVIAGELVILAVKRHLADLKNGHTRGLSFAEEKAEKAVEFFSYLKHSKDEWAGQAFTLAPWEMFLVWVLFGWMGEDGNRRFRMAYVIVARKNGKSTPGAGIGLKLAFADDEDGAEVYSAATKKDQAIIVHGEAVRMVKATPDLLDSIKMLDPRVCGELSAHGLLGQRTVTQPVRSNTAVRGPQGDQGLYCFFFAWRSLA